MASPASGDAFEAVPMSDPTYEQLARLAEDRGVWAFYATATAGVLAGVLAWRWARG